ncbi:serine/threonine-protein kinase [Thiolapillus sp.]
MSRYIGTKINRLTLVELIGKGGMGEVYRAVHDVLERDFAVKILKKEIHKDPSAVKRFEREARAASRLAHPNIVYLSDFGMLSSGELYIVMEYLKGFSLRQILRKHARLPVNRACTYLAQAAEALDFAHRMGVIHRDLKSENVMIVDQGGREVVKLLDFGLAKLLTSEVKRVSVTGEGEIFGTPEAMAPEQISGERITSKVDIYALGILAYELLVGHPPFTGSIVKVLLDHKRTVPKPPSFFRHDIPKGLERLVMKALEKDPDKRFDTAGEMAGICWQMAEPRNSGSFYADNPTVPASGDMQERIGSSEGKQVRSADSGEMAALQWREALWQLTDLLVQRGIRDRRISEILRLINEKEEELESVSLEYRSVLNEYHDFERGIRERESRIVHALISLTSVYNVRRLAFDEPEEIEDLEFQIATLRTSLDRVDSERISKENEYDSRILQLSLQLDDIDDQMEEGYQELDELVEYARREFSSSPILREMYAKVDRLRNVLQHAR